MSTPTVWIGKRLALGSILALVAGVTTSCAAETMTTGIAMRDVCTGDLGQVQTALEFLKNQEDDAAKGFLIAWQRTLDGDKDAQAVVADICSSFDA